MEQSAGHLDAEAQALAQRVIWLRLLPMRATRRVRSCSTSADGAVHVRVRAMALPQQSRQRREHGFRERIRGPEEAATGRILGPAGVLNGPVTWSKRLRIACRASKSFQTSHSPRRFDRRFVSGRRRHREAGSGFWSVRSPRDRDRRAGSAGFSQRTPVAPVGPCPSHWAHDDARWIALLGRAR